MTNRLKIILLVSSFLSSSLTSAMSDYIANLFRRGANIVSLSTAILGPISFQLAREHALQQNPSLGSNLSFESLLTLLLSSYALTTPKPRNNSQQAQDHQQNSRWQHAAPAIASGALSLAYLYYSRNDSDRDNIFVLHSITTTTILALQGYEDYRADRNRLERELERDINAFRHMERPVLQYHENEMIPLIPPAA